MNTRVRPERPPFKKNTRRGLFILAFLAPALILFLAFRIYPNIYNFYNALISWDGVSSIRKFVGLKNFIDVVQDVYFLGALRNTLLFLVIIPPVTLALALFFALVLTNRRIRFGNFFKTVFYFPGILPVSMIGIVWIFMFSPSNGMVNELFAALGVSTLKGMAWLGNTDTALGAMAVPQIWMNVGFYMVLGIAAINEIPESIMEAANIDGASRVRQAFQIQIPLIWSTAKVSVIFFIISIFSSFELILATTGGGPLGATDVLGTYMMSYIMAKSMMGTHHVEPNYGYASAIGVSTFVVVMIVTVVINYFMKKREVVQF